jgi:tRNA A-37 threonylcarbamoyl transferase component Bud32
MKHVILAEPSTLALLGLGFLLLIFAVVAVLGIVMVLVVFATRKARKEAPPTSQPTASAQVTLKNCPKCGVPMPPDSPEGLCPRCLIALNLATQTDIPGEPGAAKATPAPPQPVADIAKLFPQLEILECLGRGGMGAVYKARQPRLDRVVALKILSPEKQGNQKFAERFEREARALAKLHHPNIVTVFDFGEVQGNFYLLMEFVDGLSLRQLLQTRKLSPPEALAIVPKICEALQYAHEQGIVHRDIKPENVILEAIREGRVPGLRLIDLGVARLPHMEDVAAPHAPGTPSYMAPELFAGAPGDERSDQFALGVTIYRMFTGAYPYGEIEAFSHPRFKRAKPLTAHRPDLPAWLDEAVARATAADPDDRFGDVFEFIFALEHGAIRAAPASPRRLPLYERNPLLVWKIVAAVLALALAASLALNPAIRHGGPEKPATTQR